MEIEQAKRIYKTYSKRPNLLDTNQAIAVMETFYRELLEKDKKVKAIIKNKIERLNHKKIGAITGIYAAQVDILEEIIKDLDGR